MMNTASPKNGKKECVQTIKTVLPDQTSKVTDHLADETARGNSSTLSIGKEKVVKIINPAKPITLDRTKLTKLPASIIHRAGTMVKPQTGDVSNTNSANNDKNNALNNTKRTILVIQKKKDGEKVESINVTTTSTDNDQVVKEDLFKSIQNFLHDPINIKANMSVRKPTDVGVKFVNREPTIDTTSSDTCNIEQEQCELHLDPKSGVFVKKSKKKKRKAPDGSSGDDPEAMRSGVIMKKGALLKTLTKQTLLLPPEVVQMRRLYQIPNGRDETLFFVKCLEHPGMNEITHPNIVRPGDTFETLEEFVDYINGYGKAWKVYYSVISTLLGPQTKNDKYTKKYVFTCMFNSRRKKSQPDRVYKRRMNKFHADCPSRIVICQVRGDEHLSVITTCDHHNHPLTDELFNKLPHFNKLPLLLKEESYDLLLHGIDKGVLQKYIFEQSGLKVNTKSCINLLKNLQTDKVRRKRTPGDPAIIQQKIQALTEAYPTFKMKKGVTKEERLRRLQMNTTSGRVRKRPRKNAKKPQSPEESAETANTEAVEEVDLSRKRQNELPLRESKRSRLEERLAYLTADQEVLESVRQLQASVRNTEEEPFGGQTTVYGTQECVVTECVFDDYYGIETSTVDSENMVHEQGPIGEEHFVYTQEENSQCSVEHCNDQVTVPEGNGMSVGEVPSEQNVRSAVLEMQSGLSAVKEHNICQEDSQYFLHDADGNVITEGMVQFENNCIIDVPTLISQINKYGANIPEESLVKLEYRSNEINVNSKTVESRTKLDLKRKTYAEVAIQTEWSTSTTDFHTSFRRGTKSIHTREFDCSNLNIYVDSENRTIREEYINQYNLPEYLVKPNFPMYIESLASETNISVMSMLPSILKGSMMIKVTYIKTHENATEHVTLSLMTGSLPRITKRKENMEDIERYKQDAAHYLNSLILVKNQMASNTNYIKRLTQQISVLEKEKYELIHKNNTTGNVNVKIQLPEVASYKDINKQINIQFAEKDNQLKILESKISELAEENKELMKTNNTLHEDKQQLVREYEKLYRMYYKTKNKRHEKTNEDNEDVLLKTNLAIMKKNAALEEEALQMQLKMKKQITENKKILGRLEAERSNKNSKLRDTLTRPLVVNKKRVINITDTLDMAPQQNASEPGSLTVLYNENIIIIEDNIIQDSNHLLINKLREFLVHVMENIVQMSWLSLFKNEINIIGTNEYTYATKLSKDFINSQKKYDKIILYRKKEADQTKDEYDMTEIESLDEARDTILYVKRDGVEVIELNGPIKGIANVKGDKSASNNISEETAFVTESVEVLSETESDSSEQDFRINKASAKYSNTKLMELLGVSKLSKSHRAETKTDDWMDEKTNRLISVIQKETAEGQYCLTHSGLHPENNLISVGDKFATHNQFKKYLKVNASRWFPLYMLWQPSGMKTQNESHTYRCYFSKGVKEIGIRRPCPCKFTLRRLPDESQLTVVQACFHHTHEVDMEEHFNLMHDRRASPTFKREVMDLLREEGKTTVKSYIEKETGVTTPATYLRKLQREMEEPKHISKGRKLQETQK